MTLSQKLAIGATALTLALTGCGHQSKPADEPPRFAAEKVLTISARDYCENKGTKLTDYNFIGCREQFFQSTEEVVPKMQVPFGTEVIVDARPMPSGYIHGTALIPRIR